MRLSGKGRALGASEVKAKEESCVEAEKMRAKRQKGIRVSWNPNGNKEGRMHVPAKAPPQISTLPPQRPELNTGGVFIVHCPLASPKVPKATPPDDEASAPSNACPNGVSIALNCGGSDGE
jgi:hypothetical protein